MIDQWGDTTEYNTKRSAFWRLNKHLVNHYFGESDDNFKYLAWSNLYKISRANSGNPSDRLADLQLEVCKKILFEEIKELCPQYIIFLTSWGWAQWFLKDNANIHLQQTDGSEFVEVTGVYEYIDKDGQARKSFFIVGQHPQCKSEERHIAEIIDKIESFKSEKDYR